MKIYKTIALAILVCFSLGCSAALPPERDFQLFWNKFKAASLANDYPALEKLIHFPLEVKGVVDDIPIEKYGKNDLRKIFPKLMMQTVSHYDGADKFIDMPFADLIKTIDKVDAAVEDKHIRVEQFEFDLIDGKWYLVSAYLEE